MYLVLCICIVCLIFGFVVRFRVVVCTGTALVFVVGLLWYDFGGLPWCLLMFVSVGGLWWFLVCCWLDLVVVVGV